MSEAGQKTTDLAEAAVIDDVLGNRDNETVRVQISDLATQLVGEGAIAEAVAAIDEKVTSGRIVKGTFSDLQSIAPADDGTGGEVLDADKGTHQAASATGYDGGAQPNAGVYTWNASWGLWIRIGDTGFSGKASVDHGHEIEDVTGLPEELNGKASADHTHPMENVDGLPEALDEKAALDHGHSADNIDDGEARVSMTTAERETLSRMGTDESPATALKFVNSLGLADLVLFKDGTLVAEKLAMLGSLFVGADTGFRVDDDGDDTVLFVNALGLVVAKIDSGTSGLAERLATHLDQDGLPLAGVMNTTQMGAWHGQLALVAGQRFQKFNPNSPSEGTTGSANLGLFGDSWVYRTDFVPGFARGLIASRGTAGPGYVRLHSATVANFTNYHVLDNEELVTVQLFNNSEDNTGDWETDQGSDDTLSAGSSSSTTPGDKIAISGTKEDNPFDTATLYYLPAASASARYRWNAGPWTDVDLSDGHLQDVSVGMPENGAYVLELEVVSGAAQNLAGVALDGAGPGVRIDKLGTGGMDVDDWADIAASSSFQAHFADRNYHAVGITLGTNGQKRFGPDTFETALSEFVAQLRSNGRETLPIAVIMPCENVGTDDHFAPMDEYWAAARRVGAAMNITVHSMQAAFGPDPAVYTAGWPDPIHIAQDVGQAPAIGAYYDVFMSS